MVVVLHLLMCLAGCWMDFGWTSMWPSCNSMAYRSSMLIFWLALSVPSYWWVSNGECTGLGWFWSLTLRFFGIVVCNKSSVPIFFGRACGVWRVWIDCRWLNLSKSTTRGSAAIALVFQISWSLVVLSEDCDLRSYGRGEASLKYVRTGNERGDPLIIRVTMKQLSCLWRWNVDGMRRWSRSTFWCENSDLYMGLALLLGLGGADARLRARFLGSSELVVTWLILPVVICLSQRLSHACLSINNFVLWNCEWLIKSVIVYLMMTFYMDNCGKLELIHATKAPTSGRGVFIR